MYEEPRNRDDRRTEHRISESADKLTVKLNLKRGSATRDQDKGTIKVRGGSPEEVADNLEQTLDELEDRNLFKRIRETQPEADDE